MTAVCSHCHRPLPADRIRFGVCAGCESVTSKRVTGQFTQTPNTSMTVIAPRQINRRHGTDRRQTE